MNFSKVIFYLSAIVIAFVSLVGATSSQDTADLYGINRSFQCRRVGDEIRTKASETADKYETCNNELKDLTAVADDLHRTLAITNSLTGDCEANEWVADHSVAGVPWSAHRAESDRVRNCLENNAAIKSVVEQRELQTLACKWNVASLKQVNDYTQKLLDAAALKQEDCVARSNNRLLVPDH